MCDHHVVPGGQSRRERTHPRDKGRATLAARRCKTANIGRPGIKRSPRHIIPGQPLPFPEIQLLQSRIDDRHPKRVGDDAATLRWAGPQRPAEPRKPRHERPDRRLIGHRNIQSPVANARRHIRCRVPHQRDQGAAIRLTWAATTRHPSGNLTQVCICRPIFPGAVSRWNWVEAVA